MGSSQVGRFVPNEFPPILNVASPGTSFPVKISSVNLWNAKSIIGKACRHVPFPDLIQSDVIAIDAKCRKVVVVRGSMKRYNLLTRFRGKWKRRKPINWRLFVVPSLNGGPMFPIYAWTSDCSRKEWIRADDDDVSRWITLSTNTHWSSSTFFRRFELVNNFQWQLFEESWNLILQSGVSIYCETELRIV